MIKLGNVTRLEGGSPETDEEFAAKAEAVLARTGTEKTFVANRQAGRIVHGFNHEGRDGLRFVTVEAGGKSVKMGFCKDASCECHGQI